MKMRTAIVSVVILAGAIVHLGGCASTEHRDAGAMADVAPPPAPVDPAAERAAQEMAHVVAARAKVSEKAEGRQDLVKDDVTVKTDGSGTPIVEQKGEASWYGKRHHGRKTASGKPFDQNAMTAAHPTLPLGTKAKVTNLATGKCAEVTINDRGPYAKGRDIDVSKAAAEKIGVGKKGTAPVKIEAAVTPSPAQ